MLARVSSIVPGHPGAAERYSALVRLLMRHGRSDLVSGAGLESYVAGQDVPDTDVDSAESFARDLESMGPTYVKLGQLLSTRFDLLPPAYTTALSRLQDEVEPFPYPQVAELVAQELGSDIRHL